MLIKFGLELLTSESHGFEMDEEDAHLCVCSVLKFINVQVAPSITMTSSILTLLLAALASGSPIVVAAALQQVCSL